MKPRKTRWAATDAPSKADWRFGWPELNWANIAYAFYLDVLRPHRLVNQLSSSMHRNVRYVRKSSAGVLCF